MNKLNNTTIELQNAQEAYLKNDFVLAQNIASKILVMEPTNLIALNILGLTKVLQFKYSEAANFFRTVINLTPHDPVPYYNLAKSLQKIEDKDTKLEALKYYNLAISLKPDFIDALINKSQLLYETENYKSALICCDQILKFHSTSFKVFLNKGLILEKMEQHAESLECFDKAINLNPKIVVELLEFSEKILKINSKFLKPWLNKALIYFKLEKYDESLEFITNAIKINPNSAISWFYQGMILDKMRIYNKSLESYNKSINLDPNFAEAWLNKGSVFEIFKNYQESLNCFDRAISLSPKFGEALVGKALVQLKIGDYKNGWLNLNGRWFYKNAEPYRYPKIPELKNLENISKKNILIWYEHAQGYGDIILLSRYINLLISLKAKITFEVKKDLQELFKTSFSNCEIVLDAHQNKKKFDYQIPLGNLPLINKTEIDNIPKIIPYLKVPKKKIKFWEKNLKKNNKKINIGIACSGITVNKNSTIKSIDLHYFEPLTKIANLFLVQKNIHNEDLNFLKKHSEIIRLSEFSNWKSFEDTAAIVEFMDLIVSVDTSLVHVSGALNKKTFLILYHTHDWRWLLDREDSPWYPSIKIFRQEKIDDWHSVMQKINCEINYFLLNKR